MSVSCLFCIILLFTKITYSNPIFFLTQFYKKKIIPSDVVVISRWLWCVFWVNTEDIRIVDCGHIVTWTKLCFSHNTNSAHPELSNRLNRLTGMTVYFVTTSRTYFIRNKPYLFEKSTVYRHTLIKPFRFFFIVKKWNPTKRQWYNSAV